MSAQSMEDSTSVSMYSCLLLTRHVIYTSNHVNEKAILGIILLEGHVKGHK